MILLIIKRATEKIIRVLSFLTLLMISTSLSGQGEKKFIRQGNREYEKGKFTDSETSYRKANDKNKSFPDASFNIGDALYKQKKYQEAGKEFLDNSTMNENKSKNASALYNLGNSLLLSGKLQESIEAYKKSLKMKPENMEAKYNLAYAQDMLRQQQQKQDTDKKDQNKERNDKDKNKNDRKDQDNKQDNKQQQNDQQKQQQQQEQQQQGMSREDAERLLNSIANDEKNVQEKVKLAKALNSKVKTLKNW